MSGEDRKGVCLTMEEKRWIIKTKDENPNISQHKIALQNYRLLTGQMFV